MSRTRIYTMAGFHVDVQETYEEVQNIINASQDKQFIEFTLENGDPVTLQRTQIVYLFKF